jgi:AcrR family transcriptional regulator
MLENEHKQLPRNQIIQATFECFGDSGPRQTSMQDISRQTDYNPAVIFDLFKSKQEIIEALAEKSRNSTVCLFWDIEDSDPRDKVLQKILRNLSDVLVEQANRNTLRTKISLWSEAYESEKLMKGLRENFTDIERKIISCLEAHTPNQNQEPAFCPKEIAQILVATYHGLMLQMMLRKDTDPRNSMGHLAYLLMNLN